MTFARSIAGLAAVGGGPGPTLDYQFSFNMRNSAAMDDGLYGYQTRRFDLISDAPPTRTNANGDSVDAGWDAEPLEAVRNTGLPVQLAGIHYVANPGTVRQFRINETGVVDLALAAGDANSYQFQTVSVYDGPVGGAPIFQRLNVRTEASEWLLIDGSIVTEAAWSASGKDVRLRYTFTNYILVVLGGDGTRSSTLSSIYFEKYL